MRANTAKTEKSKMKVDEMKKTVTQSVQFDPVMEQKVKQVMDLTKCTQDNAILALHDSGEDINVAVNMLFEKGNDMEEEWQEQKGKSKKKPTSTPATPARDEQEDTNAAVNDSATENQGNRENSRSYPRNRPPRFQRGGGRNDFRARDGESPDGQRSNRRPGGDRGRGRSHGNRGRGGSRGAGDSSRGGFGRSSDAADQQDGGAIGTWTNATDANPKTDSWGDMWTDEDNQWTGDLKGTHVFESTAKSSADTFPTPTEFDPTAAAAQPTVAPATVNLNGGSSSMQAQPAATEIVDTSFPKLPVESLKPTSSSLYDNQLASDSIKSAIGMPTSSQMAASEKQQQLSQAPPASQSQQSIGLSQMYSQQQQAHNKSSKPQRVKVPPPSTKIPTAPVEMPHNAPSMGTLSVQFGAMDFTASDAKTGLTFDSSSLGGGFSVGSAAERSSAPVTSMTSSSSLYTSGSAPSTASDSMSFPNVSAQHNPPQSQHTKHQQSHINSGTQSDHHNSIYSSSQVSQHSTIYNSHSNSAHFNKPSSTTQSAAQQSSVSAASTSSAAASHPQTQAFQSNPSSARSVSSGGYGSYQMTSDNRSKQSSAGYQSSTTQTGSSAPSTSHQYNNSLYSSTTDHQPYNQYSAGVTNTGSLVTSSAAHSQAPSTLGSSSSNQQAAASSSGSRHSNNAQQPGTTSKAPPNLPHPTQQPAPVMGMPGNYMIAGGVPIFNQHHMYSMEELQKLQHLQTAAGYYDMSQYNSSMASGGSGDSSKISRLDAQSPTIQGSQNQTQSQQQQQPTTAASVPGAYMSMPPGAYPYYYNPNGLMPNPFGMYQVPSVTQNITIPGSTTSYQGQKGAGSGSGSSANYYTNSSYEDVSHVAASAAPHVSGADYSKGIYGSGKQPTNLSGGAVNSTDLSSLYKQPSNSQTAAANPTAAIYGSSPGAYVTTGHTGHMMPQQHLMQSPESGMGSRVSQSASLGKSHNKQPYYNNWAN